MANEATTVSHRRLLNFIIVAVAMLAVGVAAVSASVIYANSTFGKLQQQQRAACGSAADLGSVPIPDKPVPSRLAISLVTDNRAAWYGLGCGASLPVPPGLAKWAAHYRIPVNGKESK